MLRRLDLENLSTRVWHFLRDAPFKPREETVTEGLLVAMHRDHRTSTFVSKSTIGEEQVGGHDWLWALRSPHGDRWLHLRVQAKILFDGGAYEGLGTSRSGNGRAADQVAALFMAKRMGQLPVYVFFNGEAQPFGAVGNPRIVAGCGRSPLVRGTPATTVPAVAPLGVTLADADWVRSHIERKPEAHAPRWTIGASELNPGVIPWECLTCTRTSTVCASALPSRYLLGTAISAFLDSSTELSLGVSEQPQRWVELLQLGQADEAWETVMADGAAASNEPGLDVDPRVREGDGSVGPSPTYLLITHLAEEQDGDG